MSSKVVMARFPDLVVGSTRRYRHAQTDHLLLPSRRRQKATQRGDRLHAFYELLGSRRPVEVAVGTHYAVLVQVIPNFPQEQETTLALQRV